MDARELSRAELPPELYEIPQPPEALWLRGSLPPEGHKRLAVVGSRALSPYGREACGKLIAGLAGYPISIISGLALGADACAHRAALDAGLHTLAVPGSGLGDAVIGPRTNLGLAKDILAAGGGLLSEHEPNHKAAPWDFPSRNRIMVGLSHAVLVVEAGPKSGTLITARLTSEYNRDLLCIPHRIGDTHGFGPLLFARLGAAVVSDPVHILEALRITPHESRERTGVPTGLSDIEQLVWRSLIEPQSRDELLRRERAAAGVSELMTALISLELRGLAKEEFGAWRRT